MRDRVCGSRERLALTSGGVVWIALPKRALAPDLFDGVVRNIGFGSSRNAEVFSVNADGSGKIRLPDNDARNAFSLWSPDRSHVAFIMRFPVYSDVVVCVMNADGSGVKKLTDESYALSYSPAWSPDGSKIAFVSTREANSGIYTSGFGIYPVDVDGGEVTRLTEVYYSVSGAPVWSPDGTKIAFDAVYHSKKW